MTSAIGEAVESRRRDLNIPKTAVAKRLGMSVNTLDTRLSGNCEFKISELIEIADWWNVSLDALVGKEVPPCPLS